MFPTAAEVARRRWTLTTVFRCAALLAPLLALFPFTSWVTEGFADDDFWDLGYYAPRVAMTVGFTVATPFIFLLAGPLASLVVPVPKPPACPRCRYPVPALRDERCPECGLAIGRTPDAREAAEAAAVMQLEARRSRSMARLAIGIPVTAMSAVGVLVQLAMLSGSDSPERIGWAAAWAVIWTLVGFGGVVLVVGGRNRRRIPQTGLPTSTVLRQNETRAVASPSNALEPAGIPISER